MTRLYVNSNQTGTRIWYFRHRVTNNTIVLLQEATWWNSETCGQIPYMCAINVQRLPVIKPRHTTHVYQDRRTAVHGDRHKYLIVVLYHPTPNRSNNNESLRNNQQKMIERSAHESFQKTLFPWQSMIYPLSAS